MIPWIGSISINHLSFAVLAGLAVLIAWSGWRTSFVLYLGVASLIMVATWVTPAAAVALLAFIVPPYIVIRFLWGRAAFQSNWPVAALILWQILLFVALQRSEWTTVIPGIDHPLTVIGLSYMLFRIIHLIVDAPHLGHLRFDFWRYLSYLLAFWTLLSGPIQRYEAFDAGLEEIGNGPGETWLKDAHRGVNGLFKAFLISPLFLKSADISALRLPGADWTDFAIVFYSYPIYLYLNFSGYTDVVIAICRLCGMTTMPENFNRPYLARNIQDFWTRWHMSFSNWIRFYIFTPMSKALVARSSGGFVGVSMSAAVIATFVIVGLWHGLAFSFFLFGVLHGAAVIVTAIYGRVLSSLLGKSRRRQFEQNHFIHGISIFICFHYVCATLVLINNSYGDLSGALTSFFMSGA